MVDWIVAFTTDVGHFVPRNTNSFWGFRRVGVGGLWDSEWVSKAKDVIVRVATATGQWIEVTAKSAYGGAAALWKDIWGRDKAKGGSIEIDPRNPLRGRYVRDLEFRHRQVDAEGHKDEITVLLYKPAVSRSTASSDDWTLDKSNFPAGLRD